MALPAALQPLESPVFRGLWLAWLAANLTMWMNDVAAAWLMTSLTTSPVMVALVQAASTLPVFLLGLPSGALADIVDRRRYFAFTQLWVTAVALVLAALSLSGRLTAEWLLALTFANGVGMAMRWPVFAAIVPMVVPRETFPQALALNGIAMNLSRVIGPVLAGALLAAVSPAAVFVLNAALALFAFTMILRWKYVRQTSALPGERFIGAIRVGFNYARQAPRLRVILLRVFLFFLQSTALVALLPLVAQGLHDGGAGVFTVMLSCLGAGAVVAALYFPKWRARHGPDRFVVAGTLVHAAASVLVVTVPSVWAALPAMFVAGMAWISVANSLTLAAQNTMPDWVRARGMAIYQTALMGGSAAGALLWGQVAGLVGVQGSVLAAAAFGVVVSVVLRRASVVPQVPLDFSPAAANRAPEPAEPVADDAGPVLVSVEYLIDPTRADAFAAVMQRTRRARLRQGALSWGLFRDVAVPGRYVETFVDENWLEHQRRLERFTAFDAELRAERMAFHLGPEPPRLVRYVAEARVDPPAR